MKLSLLNPYYTSPVETWVTANKAAVQTWLQAPAQMALSEISFDYIRANVASMAGRTDGELAEMCKVLGIAVVGQ